MIFLDTSFLFALFARHDPDHGRVREVYETYRGKRMADLVLTTNHVVMETITLVRYKGSRDRDAPLRIASPSTSAVRSTRASSRRSTRRHRKRSAPPSTTWPSTTTRSTARSTA